MLYQLDDSELELVNGLPLYTKLLWSAVVHMVIMGVLLADPALRAHVGQLCPIDAGDGDWHGGRIAAKYIRLALRNNFQADQLSSPFISPAILQIFIWCTFAFGDQGHMAQATLTLDANPPALSNITTMIQNWVTKAKLSIQVYGSFMIEPQKIPTMLALMWEISQEIRAKADAGAVTFEEIYNMLVQKKIIVFRSGGLVTWLCACDFSEYRLCSAPTPTDLAKHLLIGERHPSGPLGGLELIEISSWQPQPTDVAELAQVFTDVMNILQNPSPALTHTSLFVSNAVRIQGYNLSIIDLEHILCKFYSEDTMRGKKYRLVMSKAAKAKAAAQTRAAAAAALAAGAGIGANDDDEDDTRDDFGDDAGGDAGADADTNVDM
ncbi:hypothetical protein G7Y89_g13437 [Cudoniella acicularis]|uniref:Uncharacterized protein n=1 Tax=Cudoniella acicularis TaxID=354080 RepID=A0A8H4VWF5_9HELO|nr:hypothetical protein G7Y89_g13437 [Cudoniella acicularis]